MKRHPYAWATQSLIRKREELGLSQQQVADKFGLKEHTLVGRWERGVVLPNLVNVFKLAALYDTRPDFLFPKLMRGILVEFNLPSSSLRDR